jgi:hypothetical protein
VSLTKENDTRAIQSCIALVLSLSSYLFEIKTWSVINRNLPVEKC